MTFEVFSLGFDRALVGIHREILCLNLFAAFKLMMSFNLYSADKPVVSICILNFSCGLILTSVFNFFVAVPSLRCCARD